MCEYDKQAYLLPIDMPRSEYPTSDINFELTKMTEELLRELYLLPIDKPRSEYPTSDFNFELPKMSEVLPKEAYLLPIDMPRSEYPTNDFIEKKLIEAQTKVEVI